MRGMSQPLRRGLLALAGAVVLAAPASAQSRREMQMMADIRMLQEQTQQLQQQLQAALQALGDNLKAINQRLDDSNGINRKAFADQKLVVDQFGSDLRVVRERVDETNVRITSLSQEVEALRLAIPQYPPPAMTTDPNAVAGGAPANPAAPPTGVPVAPAAPAPMPQAPPVAPGISPQRMFDTSYADFTSGQWSLCAQGFDGYLRSFPQNDAADDAQFYIGECQYNDGKFAEAVEAYSRVISAYPRGDKVPDAYYKRGLVLDRMGQTDQAKESWETLMKQFPDSDLARLAKQNLDRLNRGKPPGR